MLYVNARIVVGALADPRVQTSSSRVNDVAIRINSRLIKRGEQLKNAGVGTASDRDGEELNDQFRSD